MGFAVACSERVISLVLAGTIVAPDEDEWRTLYSRLHGERPGPGADRVPGARAFLQGAQPRRCLSVRSPRARRQTGRNFLSATRCQGRLASDGTSSCAGPAAHRRG
jgi:hypothetical protein